MQFQCVKPAVAYAGLIKVLKNFACKHADRVFTDHIPETYLRNIIHITYVRLCIATIRALMLHL